MHPEMYLPMQRLVERERDERLARRRPRPVPSVSAGECTARTEHAGPIARAIVSLRATAAPSSCCAMA